MNGPGACHGGRITGEAVIDPEKTGACQSTDRRVLTGSAWRASVAALRAIGLVHLAGRARCTRWQGA